MIFNPTIRMDFLNELDISCEWKIIWISFVLLLSERLCVCSVDLTSIIDFADYLGSELFVVYKDRHLRSSISIS